MSTTLANTATKGDIYYATWGYDQTNYDFLIVESVSSTGKSALCRMVRADMIGVSGTCNVLRPCKETVGKQFRMFVRDSGQRLRGSYPFCAVVGDSSSMRLDTFNRHVGDKTYNETMPEFGH